MVHHQQIRLIEENRHHGRAKPPDQDPKRPKEHRRARTLRQVGQPDVHAPPPHRQHVKRRHRRLLPLPHDLNLSVRTLQKAQHPTTSVSDTVEGKQGRLEGCLE